MDGATADRLDLWCEDLSEAMAGDVRDSADMARRLTGLWAELGTVWPAGIRSGVYQAQGDMLKAVAESKGFQVGGRGFDSGFTAVMGSVGMDGAMGRRALYRLLADGTRGDGTSRDVLGRELAPNGRPSSMERMPPGTYARAIGSDSRRIRAELASEGGSAPEDSAPQPAPETRPARTGAWDRLKAALSGGRDRGTEMDGPEP